MNGLREAPQPPVPHTPEVSGKLVREPVARRNVFQQAGERYRSLEQW